MSAGAEAIYASGVRHRYGRTEVLRGVDVTLRVGEAALLAGRNGSGKSTLLRVLAGLERPTAGVVRVAGHDAARDLPAVRRAAGYVPEAPAFDAELSARETLGFHARCAGLDGAELRGAVDSMLELVDLVEQRHRRPGELSRGQRQRLAIARALVRDPAVLLLDEPLGTLDVPGQAELAEVLYELKAIGRTLLVGTQAPRDLADWADELALLVDGRVIAGPVDQFRAPGPGERRVRLVVLAGAEAAEALLRARAGVVAVEREPGDEGAPTAALGFALRHDGDDAAWAAALARLVRELVEGGVALVEVRPEAPDLVDVE